MAKKNRGKRYWPALLLAAVLAESAHAPLMSGAVASDKTQSANKTTASTGKESSVADKKLPPPLVVPPTDNPTVAKKIEPPLLPLLKDLFPPLPLPPPEVAATNPQLEASPTQPISLLHTASSDSTGAGTGGGNPVLRESPSTGNDLPVATAPAIDPLPSAPGSPPNDKPVIGAGPDPIATVPEPTGATLLFSGAVLLSKRRSRV